MQSSATQYSVGKVKLLTAEEHLEQNNAVLLVRLMTSEEPSPSSPTTIPSSVHNMRQSPCGFGSAPDITLTLSYTSNHIS